MTILGVEEIHFSGTYDRRRINRSQLVLGTILLILDLRHKLLDWHLLLCSRLTRLTNFGRGSSIQELLAVVDDVLDEGEVVFLLLRSLQVFVTFDQIRSLLRHEFFDLVV